MDAALVLKDILYHKYKKAKRDRSIKDMITLMAANKTRRDTEKHIFERMSLLYCRGHKHEKVPCDNCSKVIKYAQQRIDACKFGDNKTFCSKCTIHCFKLEMREEVRKIMRYSGPRMVFYHPVEVIKHLLLG